MTAMADAPANNAQLPVYPVLGPRYTGLYERIVGSHPLENQQAKEELISLHRRACQCVAYAKEHSDDSARPVVFLQLEMVQKAALALHERINGDCRRNCNSELLNTHHHIDQLLQEVYAALYRVIGS